MLYNMRLKLQSYQANRHATDKKNAKSDFSVGVYSKFPPGGCYLASRSMHDLFVFCLI